MAPGCDADVIVAGAGPAGAVAARRLAMSGVRCLLVDRATFPRNKPCGGGISARALSRFPWLAGTLADAGVDVHRIARLHLEGPEQSVMQLTSPRDCVLLVRRVEFDNALVGDAVRTGAELVEGFEITQADLDDQGGVRLQARDGRQLRARRVIAADGVHSVIAKRLGVNPRWPRTHLALDMMEETPVERLEATSPDVLWVAYAHAGLDGYAYVFPKTAHVNVGIGCLLSHFDESVDARPYALQEAFVHALVDRGVLRGQSDRRCFTPFLIPVGGPLRRASRGPVLFAGDAGGFVNAVTAEGIYYAMVSGELAADALIAARDAPPARAARHYANAWRGELGPELRDATLLQRYLFSSHARVARVVRGASGLPWLTDLILEYFRGEVPYSAVRRRIIVRFPGTALKLARERLGGWATAWASS